MKKIISIVFICMLAACSSYEKMPQRLEYHCTLNKPQFFLEIPEVIRSHGFEIYNSDELRNHIVAIYDTTVNEEKVQLNLSIAYDSISQNYWVSPSARFTKDSATKVEYYNKNKMNKHFKTKFEAVLNHLEIFCQGNFFPNRP
mgnify:CR=1 FL=1